MRRGFSPRWSHCAASAVSNQMPTIPEEPEAKRGAKGILNGFMPSTAPYSETADQPALSAAFDLGQAYRRAASFRKFVKELYHVLTQLGQQPGIPEDWTL